MKFYEKLDFLMSITKTSNSALSMRISLDASHISRLRRGERKLVRNAEYIKQMAVFFVHQCVSDYQINALLERVNMPAAQFKDPVTAAERVYLWLLSEEKSEADSVTGFLHGMEGFRKGSPQNDSMGLLSDSISVPTSDISLFYGVEGKREAVLKFLTVVSRSRTPGLLLLYSDESMDWLTQDAVFQMKWRNLLSEVISKGNHIRIIHTVSRNLDEMLEALSKWIPLYMTGSIEPFYYPKIRDGIFRRTLFIAPDKAAVSSSSIGSMDDKVTNFLFRKEKVIASLEEEFNNYLSLCKPLMRIFTDKNRSEYLQTLEEFENEIENTIIKTDGLSLLTMPDHVIYSMLERTKLHNKEELMGHSMARKERFLKNLREKSFTEIIKLGDVQKVKDGLIPVCRTGIDGLFGLRYHPAEYRDHIENIIHLMNTYDNYHVVIDRETKENGYRLYAKEDMGVIVEKITEPNVIFAMNEGNMTAAFWNYLSVNLSEAKQVRQKIMKELQDAVEALSQSADD
jgi:hypothetical protein